MSRIDYKFTKRDFEALKSNSEDFEHFKSRMTTFAKNQLDLHRFKYYSLSRGTYQQIMKCYENPHQTNEETDKCAKRHRE